MKTKTPTNVIANFLRFIGMAVTTGVTCFVLMVILIKPTEFWAIVFNKAVVGLFTLVIGAVIGFIAGAVATYIRISKEVAEKEHTISIKENKILKLQHQLDETREALHNMNRSCESQHQSDNCHRINDLFKQIRDLSRADEPAEIADVTEPDSQEEPANAES